MMNLFFLVFVLFAVPAFAEQAVSKDSSQIILVDKAACRYVTKHIPDADVAYKPGVDVHGKKVAPADIAPPTDYHVEDNMYLRLNLDAAKAFGLKVPNIPTVTPGSNPNVPAVMDETVAGYITFKQGKAYLNNVPLDDAGQGQLAVLCRQQKPQ